MKGVIGLAFVVVAIGVVANMFFTRELMRDQGLPLAIAWGATTSETVEMQIGVGPLIPVRDPPEINPNTGNAMWVEWEKAHYQIRDESGGEVPLRRMGTGALFLDSKAAGNPEFILCANLKKSAKYSCDFVPVLAENKRYRYSFNAPRESQKVGRELFERVIEP